MFCRLFWLASIVIFSVSACADDGDNSKENVEKPVCIQLYDPVCGKVYSKKDTGYIKKQFSNMCYAKAYNAREIEKGECYKDSVQN